MKHAWPLLLLLIPLGTAATITGTVYDYSLKPVTDAIVSINTTPEQTTVTEQGHYELEVPKGEYELKVHKSTAQGLLEQATTSITVTQEGTYTYDLILFQELEELDRTEELDELLKEPEKKTWPYWLLVIIGASIIGASIIANTRKPAPTGEKGPEEQVLEHVKREGTTTQKDIRKAFPYSEAKISLIIASLEAQGKLKKMKKGRGNIIKYENKEKR